MQPDKSADTNSVMTLEPCPFCGGTPGDWPDCAEVCCQRCGASVTGSDPNAARTAWNKRSLPTSPVQSEQRGSVQSLFAKAWSKSGYEGKGEHAVARCFYAEGYNQALHDKDEAVAKAKRETAERCHTIVVEAFVDGYGTTPILERIESEFLPSSGEGGK